MPSTSQDTPEATVVVSAPGRCGIIGNPTDMYGGSVLSCTIAERGYVSIRPTDRLTLESDQGVITIRSRDDLRQRGDHFDVLRAVISQQQCLGMKAHFTCWSDVPIGSGLSSSSSLVVAALYALVSYQGRAMSRYFFAETARGIELNDMGVICGYQDFYMPTFGGLNYMEFRDKEFYREVHSEPYAAVESLTPLVPELPLCWRTPVSSIAPMSCIDPSANGGWKASATWCRPIRRSAASPEKARKPCWKRTGRSWAG